MADRPIIFSAPMIAALLAGRKTMTRRVIKKQPALDALAVFGPTMLLKPGCADLLPYAPGDRLWVREAWGHTGDGVWTIADARRRGGRAIYRADHEEARSVGPRVDVKWWPSIHMPREFSRLTLHVTDVQVERLQSISEEDAIAEGVEPWGPNTAFVKLEDGQHYSTPRGCFRKLWESIHGAGSWDRNPWVTAITFRPEQRNIDA